jgi:uncharacterized protein (TIGR04222 family)
VTIAAAPTWGVSSGVFLLVYAVVAVVVLVASRRARRALADPAAGKALMPDLERHPHDLAYLNGGPDLAVYSALSAMHLRGTVSTARGVVRPAGHVHDCPNDLERVIHASTGSGVRVRRLAGYYEVARELRAARERLVAAGLLLSDEQRGRIRRVGLWMLAVAGLGLLRILAGVANAAPVGFITAMTFATAITAFVLMGTAPRRTGAGDRVLTRLRGEQHALAPSMSPDWTVYGPQGAALAIGIYGTTALWASDPAFAEELALQRSAAGSDGGASWSAGSWGGGSDGGSGGGGGGGGCGGGGGGGGCGGGG